MTNERDEMRARLAAMLFDEVSDQERVELESLLENDAELRAEIEELRMALSFMETNDPRAEAGGDPVLAPGRIAALREAQAESEAAAAGVKVVEVKPARRAWSVVATGIGIAATLAIVSALTRQNFLESRASREPSDSTAVLSGNLEGAQFADAMVALPQSRASEAGGKGGSDGPVEGSFASEFRKGQIAPAADTEAADRSAPRQEIASADNLSRDDAAAPAGRANFEVGRVLSVAEAESGAVAMTESMPLDGREIAAAEPAPQSAGAGERVPESRFGMRVGMEEQRAKDEIHSGNAPASKPSEPSAPPALSSSAASSTVFFTQPVEMNEAAVPGTAESARPVGGPEPVGLRRALEPEEKKKKTRADAGSAGLKQDAQETRSAQVTDQRAAGRYNEPEPAKRARELAKAPEAPKPASGQLDAVSMESLSSVGYIGGRVGGDAGQAGRGGHALREESHESQPARSRRQVASAPPMTMPAPPRPPDEPYRLVPDAVPPPAARTDCKYYNPPRCYPLPEPPPALPDAMFFKQYGINPMVEAAADALSTFAVDVDTASWTIARSYLSQNMLPPQAAPRVEEFVNAVPERYAPPTEDTFAVYSEMAPSPFGPGYHMLKVGVKGRETQAGARKPLALTFVIDVSGSMNQGDRIGLVKRTLKTLTASLRPEDSIAIAVYNTTARAVLSHTPVTNLGYIHQVIDGLHASGSTNVAEGLSIGYSLARGGARPGSVSRVILCSDGVANTGITDIESMVGMMRYQGGDDVYLTAIGVGMGNYNDVLLEQIANKANGHYAYIDNDREANRFLFEDLLKSMEVIAADVKIQVEFNPAAVVRYRLLGYENRDVADVNFRNDAVDAGEIGAGHSVTALYEVQLGDGLADDEADDRLATVRVRFKDTARSREVREIGGALRLAGVGKRFEETDEHFRLAVAAAEFAEILRGSYWAQGSNLYNLGAFVDQAAAAGPASGPYAVELRRMIGTAAGLMPAYRMTTWPPEPMPGQTGGGQQPAPGFGYDDQAPAEANRDSAPRVEMR